MPERQVVVTCDAEACNVVYPGGDIESVLWNDLERVEIHTNDSGPWFADVWWVLVGKSSQCSYPLGATGETEALERLQQLQGFDNEAVGKAMQCTDNARFLCWERVGRYLPRRRYQFEQK